MKKTWQGIKQIINLNRKDTTQISHIEYKNKHIDNNPDMANAFNEFFTGIGPALDKDIPHNHKPGGPTVYLKSRMILPFLISPTNPVEIETLINSLDDSKSSGPTSIPTRLLKLIGKEIAIPFSDICNMSFNEGIFPSKNKIAKVVPHHKNGSTQAVDNYRPISLLSTFSKIMEKIMTVRLTNFLELHDIIYPKQFGFRKGHSTSHSLIDIVETIRKTIDSKKFGCGVFIDLKKAFDTVNHDILLQKLEHYGIRHNSLKWFKSYLSDRNQYVHLNDTDSSTMNISCGVPQGSVLGPILFLIYINDLPNISNKLKFFLFADDTNIYLEGNDLSNLEKTMNKELKKLYEWLCLNRLSLNISKTNFIIFSPPNTFKKPVTIKIAKKAISEAKYVKYLGVLIDSNLSFKYHIEELTKKVARAIGVLYKIKPFVSAKILTNIYYAIIYPFLLYGVVVWGNASNVLLKPIHILQKTFVRMATNNDTNFTIHRGLAHTPPLFHQLNLLTIYDIFKLQVAKLVYESVNDIGPTNKIIKYIRASDVHHYNTRYSANNNFYTTFVRTTRYGLKNLQIEGKKTWENVPDNIKTSLTTKLFKTRYKKHLITDYLNN